MANALYGKGREGFLDGAIDWSGDDIRAILVDLEEYSVEIDDHEYLSSVGAGARVATSPSFGGKTSTLGVADANDITFSSVTGEPIGAIIIYQHTGSDATARLIAYIDTDTEGSIDVTPNGGDINVIWDDGANKIFKL